MANERNEQIIQSTGEDTLNEEHYFFNQEHSVTTDTNVISDETDKKVNFKDIKVPQLY